MLAEGTRYINEHPGTTIFLGDGGHVGCRQEVDALFSWLELLEVPWIYVSGNHDHFLMGAIAGGSVSSAASIAGGVLVAAANVHEHGGRWDAACAGTTTGDSVGPANKAWLVQKISDHFDAMRSRRPQGEQDYWRKATTLPPDPGADPWYEHWTSWIVQVFPSNSPVTTDGPVTLVVALDTSDWSQSGTMLTMSPGAEGCVSSSQADRAKMLVGEIRAIHPGQTIKVIVAGHHDLASLSTVWHAASPRPWICATAIKQLMRDLGATDYIAGHTHVRQEGQYEFPYGLFSDGLPWNTLTVGEHVVGSVTNAQDGGPPSIERIMLQANGGYKSRRGYPVTSIIEQAVGEAEGICCADIWSDAPTPPETRDYYAPGLGATKTRWFQLSLSHLENVGAWCSREGVDSPCDGLSRSCRNVYSRATTVLQELGGRAVDSPSSRWEGNGDLGRCVRDGLGLSQTDPGQVDPEIEQYVVCTALRGAAEERSHGSADPTAYLLSSCAASAAGTPAAAVGAAAGGTATTTAPFFSVDEQFALATVFSAPRATEAMPPLEGALASGRSVQYDVTIHNAGCYSFLAASDAGNLDMEISSGGAVLGQDVRLESSASVVYCANGAMTIRVKLTLLDAAGNYKFGVFNVADAASSSTESPRSSSGIQVGGANPDEIGSQIRAFVERHMQSLVPVSDVVRRDLQESQESQLVVGLPPGHCYTLVGANAVASNTVEVTVTGPDGYQLATGSTTQDGIIVLVTAPCPEAAGDSRVEIRMERGSGGFGFQVFLQ